jgi:fucose 4-O-acetylase-like acetyltransferase
MQTALRPISLVAKDPRTGRIVWADNAKAILITLVALGHFTALDLNVKTVVYAFHLPAFLFITGFFLPQKLASLSFAEFSRKYVFPYIRLFVFVTLVSVLIWWAGYLALRHHMLSPVEAILDGLYGTQWQGHLFIHKNNAIWYLPFLICSLVALYIALRLPVWAAIIAIVGYFCFGVFYTGWPLPWSAGAGGVGVTFAYAGFMFRRYLANGGDHQRFTFSRLNWCIIAGLAFVVLVVLALVNGATNINLLELGVFPALYVPTAFAGILAIAGLSAVLPHSRLADELSAHSLVIFCIHLYAVKVVNHLHLFADQPAIQLIFLACAAILIVIASMFVSILVMPWISRAILRRS